MSKDEGYRLYRGRCRELSESAIDSDPALTLVRGHYYCPIWNRKEPHWWCARPDGTIVDPSKGQFPSAGMGEYTPFDGVIACAQCGAEIDEAHAVIEGNYACCSTRCMMSLVGLGDLFT